MSTKAKRYTLTLTLSLRAAVLMWLITWSRAASTCRRLPDGSIFRIVDVYYGTNHQYMDRNRPRWQVFLSKHIPATWAARRGWSLGGGLSIRSGSGEPLLAVFTIRDAAPPAAFFADLRAEFFDEDGNS